LSQFVHDTSTVTIEAAPRRGRERDRHVDDERRAGNLVQLVERMALLARELQARRQARVPNASYQPTFSAMTSASSLATRW
jgi:hypothetical protein